MKPEDYRFIAQMQAGARRARTATIWAFVTGMAIGIWGNPLVGIGAGALTWFVLMVWGKR